MPHSMPLMAGPKPNPNPEFFYATDCPATHPHTESPALTDVSSPPSRLQRQNSAPRSGPLVASDCSSAPYTSSYTPSLLPVLEDLPNCGRAGARPRQRSCCDCGVSASHGFTFSVAMVSSRASAHVTLIPLLFFALSQRMRAVCKPRDHILPPENRWKEYFSCGGSRHGNLL